jgi:hypothetical protein
MIFGLFMMMTGMTGSLIIGWELQNIDLLLGHTVGVFGMILSALLGVDYMARRMK